MAYLEDYKMDPNGASPLLTFTIFDDYATTKNLSLVRIDILNKNIQEYEGQKIVRSLLDNYIGDEYAAIKTFNKRPNDFDIEDFIARMNDRWKEGDKAGVEPPSS